MVDAAWRVVVWEHERGWGAKPDFHKDFDSKKEALEFMNEFNSKNTETVVPDWYMVAKDPVLVDLSVD